MRGWLVDTNILSELRRPRLEPKVITWISALPLASLHVSIVTVAEIRFGIERLDDAIRRAELSDWLTHQVRPMFEGRVLPFSEDVMLKWRILVEAGRKVGHTFSQPDLLLASTALYYGLTMMSRDTAEYTRAGVAVTNPWTDPPLG